LSQARGKSLCPAHDSQHTYFQEEGTLLIIAFSLRIESARQVRMGKRSVTENQIVLFIANRLAGLLAGYCNAANNRKFYGWQTGWGRFDSIIRRTVSLCCLAASHV
jgi:hypothetical protein